jgi:hypothetical protein
LILNSASVAAPAVAPRAYVPEYIFHIPLGCYFSKLFPGFKLPPEIQTERTIDGDLLMIATEEKLDPDFPEHVQRARILAKTMIIPNTLRNPRGQVVMSRNVWEWWLGN